MEAAAGHAATVEATLGNRPLALTTSIRTVASAPDLLRALSTAQEDYFVFSPRPGLTWDQPLLQRVAREVATVEALGIPWFCLCADGQDLDGQKYAAAFFNNEPTLAPDRGRKLIVQTAGTLYVVKAATMRNLGPTARIASDLVSFMNTLIVVAYGRGFASAFTSGIFPCLAEHRSLSYVDFDQQLATINLNRMLAPADATDVFPPGMSNRALVADWIQGVASNLHVKHSFSFVIRTLFRRNQMLRRCLISVEYLRISLDIPVEIVLATDAVDAEISASFNELRKDFPNLKFVLVSGDSETQYPYSRVRNLIAGLKATTGARVCVIDDDDYYAPQAVSSFAQACEFGADQLVIFGSQIVYERWIAAKVKHHVTITGYGTRYDAKAWTNTLRGSNSIPLCGLIHPGWFARQVAQEYAYNFDLSEDFAFHLRCFAHPKRPPIRVIDDICAYQSHRVNDDNVSNVEDRAGWVADTGNGLFQLLFEDERTFDVLTQIQVLTNDRMASLEAEVVRADQGRDDAVRGLAGQIQRVSTLEVQRSDRIATLEAEVVRAHQDRDEAVRGLAAITQQCPSPSPFVRSQRRAVQMAKKVLKRVLGRH